MNYIYNVMQYIGFVHSFLSGGVTVHPVHYRGSRMVLLKQQGDILLILHVARSKRNNAGYRAFIFR